jgi:uncharacterized protein YciI
MEPVSWLYRIQPVRDNMLSDGPTEHEQALVGQHFNYLKELHSRGVVRLAGRTLNTHSNSFGLVLFCAPDEEAALALMRGDPAVAAGVFRAELFPFRVAL